MPDNVAASVDAAPFCPLPFKTKTPVCERVCFAGATFLILCTTAGVVFFGVAGASAEASACRCTACASGFASSMTAAPIRSTSSIAATRLATSVAVRQGRTRASGEGSGASTAPLVSLLRRGFLRPRPRSGDAVVQRHLCAPAELARRAGGIDHGCDHVAEPGLAMHGLFVDERGAATRSV